MKNHSHTSADQPNVPLPAGYSLRTMTAVDVPAVLTLEQALFPQDAWPERFFYDELSQAAPAVAERRATRQYWVVERELPAEGTGSRHHSGAGTGAEVVGYAGMMCVLPLADVQTVAVAPPAQGAGLGTALLRLIEQESRRRGAEDLLLEVRQDNPGAQRLYLREGFEQIHQRAGYYPDGGDALIMRKRLHQPEPSSAANLRGHHDR